MLKKLWLLFFTFAKIAAFVLGGGLAMLPVIEETFVNKKKLLTGEELLDVVALTQTVPGIIAANAAVSIGMKIAGFAGAVAALLGAIFPSFVIILSIAWLFPEYQGRHFKALPYHSTFQIISSTNKTFASLLVPNLFN